MLNESEVKELKKQIISQITNWPTSEDKKQEAISQIKVMDSKQLEEFLIQNNLIQKKEQGEKAETTVQKKEQECPFCLISQGKIPSHIIDENKTSIAVLEINPVSKGHSIVIPKEHNPIEKVPSQALTLAKKISRKLKSKLKPEAVEISSSTIQGHAIINVIPIYKDKKQERKKETEENLKKLQSKLMKKLKPKTIKKKVVSKKQLENAPRRIP